jgi:nitrile hydratase accessory protein
MTEIERAAAVLGPSAPFPTVDGEPVFAEPWEGRAFAMAVDLVVRLDASWETFRGRLVAAIAEDPERPYYESWVVALERLALETGAVSGDALDQARAAASG